jgi:hypothetical protein
MTARAAGGIGTGAWHTDTGVELSRCSGGAPLTSVERGRADQLHEEASRS